MIQHKYPSVEGLSHVTRRPPLPDIHAAMLREECELLNQAMLP